MDDKYVVLKRQDWKEVERALEKLGFPPLGDENREVGLPLDDAVVIRRQDVFAPPALDAYANAILVAIEGIRAANPSIEWDLDAPVLGRLREIADYFHQQAELSWQTERKIPD